MRVRKLLGLAVTLVALAVVVNALAFTKATVTNTTSITIDTSSLAGLAIIPNLTGNGFTASETNGYVDVTFTEKFQPNSEYIVGPIFSIKNNSGQAANITHTDATLTGGATATLAGADGTTSIDGSLAGGGTVTRDVYVKVTVPQAYNTTGGHTQLGTAQTSTIVIKGN